MGDTTAGDKVIITVRPENILLSVGVSDKIGNVVTGEVDHLIYLGNMLDCIVRVCSERIRVQLHPSYALVRGEKVTLHFPTEHCVAIRE